MRGNIRQIHEERLFRGFPGLIDDPLLRLAGVEVSGVAILYGIGYIGVAIEQRMLGVWIMNMSIVVAVEAVPIIKTSLHWMSRELIFNRSSQAPFPYCEGFVSSLV